MCNRFAILAAALVFGIFAVVVSHRAWAQSNPTADQLIQKLKPTGAIGGGTRGIRPVTPTAPVQEGSSTAPAAKPAAAPVAAPAKPLSADLTVQFATGSAELTPQAMRVLDELGKALTSADLSAFRFRIAGHTDTVGTPEMNKALSDQRAAAVAAYLEGKFGVPAARLETVGMGEADLAVATPPQTPEPRNRRVQVINLGS